MDKNKIFIEKARKIHGDVYDYSKVKYVGIYDHVCIICPKHGEFWQTPNVHLRRHGCPKCGAERTYNSMRSNKEQFIEKAKKIHGDVYDYSNAEYVNAMTKVNIKCKKCGNSFMQVPAFHLTGKGCPYCARERTKINVSMHTMKEFADAESTFIDRMKKLHCDEHGNPLYDYSKTEYKGNKEKVCIICPEHGEFWQKASNHKHGEGCPMCKIRSKGELAISRRMTELGISFESEKMFDGLVGVNGGSLRFDFFIASKNTAIEFDGKQHFEHIKIMMTEEEFRTLVYHDTLKNEYCKAHGIKLIRVSKETLKYFLYNDIKSLTT